MNKYELRKLLSLSLPIELAKEITSYLSSSDIKPKIIEEVVFIPKFRNRHRYLRQLMSF